MVLFSLESEFYTPLECDLLVNKGILQGDYRMDRIYTVLGQLIQDYDLVAVV